MTNEVKSTPHSPCLGEACPVCREDRARAKRVAEGGADVWRSLSLMIGGHVAGLLAATIDWLAVSAVELQARTAVWSRVAAMIEAGRFRVDVDDDDDIDDDEQPTPTEHGPMCPCDRCKMERAQ